MKIVGRIIIVLGLLFTLFMIAAMSLTRDRCPEPFFSLTATVPGETKASQWQFLVTQSGQLILSENAESAGDSGAEVEFDQVLQRIDADAVPQAVFTGTSYAEGRGSEVWRFTVDSEDAGELVFALEENDKEPVKRTLTIAEFGEVVRKQAVSRDLKPTRQASLEEVLALKLPSPTLTAVSFPGRFTYADALRIAGRDASPVTPDDVEVLEITRFAEAPGLRDRNKLTKELRERGLEKIIPENLPPVAERLPLYPAVVRGWEKENNGVGSYGGAWRRATANAWDVPRKIAAESFIRFDPSGNVQPALAYKWKIEDNFKTYTFYLRKGQRWSDGEPFTSHDIAFVINDNMESAHWGEGDPWMQKRNGANMLYVDDIKDWQGLVDYLLTERQSKKPTVGRQIWEQFVRKLALTRQDAAKLLLRPDEKEKPFEEFLKNAADEAEKLMRRACNDDDQDAREELTMRFNSTFTLKTFYDKATWAEVDLQNDLKALEDKGVSHLDKDELWLYDVLLSRNDLLRRMTTAGIREPEQDVGDKIDAGGELIRLNQMLFRAAMKDYVVPPYYERVIVEPVADENGDDTHIVRFRFPRPNSFFLEQTGTFMFYRGIFDMPKHYYAPLHPAGSKILNVIDILQWPEFLKTLHAEGQCDGEELPGTRVWKLMKPEMQEAVKAHLGKKLEVYEKGFQQSLVDELNRICHSRDLYSAAAWSTVKLNVEREKILKDGYTRIRDRGVKNRILEIFQRDDMLKRGVADLDDEELYRFNQSMLRAAFAVGRFAEEPLMGNNREHSLNIDANRQPRKYASWVTRIREMGVATDNRIPHIPSLRAWIPIWESHTHCVAIRNPYYYRVDIEGNQLPYLDAIVTKKIPEPNNVILELVGGHVDFQVRSVEFTDFTVLKMSEEKGDYEIRLWPHDYVGELTFVPIQYSKDPGYAALQAQPKFRHALSMALNRQEIIDVMYNGIGTPANWGIPRGSPYYNEKLVSDHVDYNPQEAERILDELGLDKRDAMGKRIFPDGRPFILLVSVTPEQKFVFDAVQMACNYWQDIGINAQMRQNMGDALTRWADMGKLDMRVHKEGASFFGPLLPGGFMPSHSAECPQWPQWTAWVRSSGRIGREPPDHIKMLDSMFNKVMNAPTEEAKIAAWQELADYTANQRPIIGVTTSPGKIVYVHNTFKNVPKIALAGWIAHEPNNVCPEIFYTTKKD